MENLEKVAKNLDSGDLPVEVMLLLVKHPAAVIDKNAAENEKKLFMLVWDKIKLTKSEKEKYMADLLRAIHLPQVDRETLGYIATHADEIPEIKGIIVRAKNPVGTTEIREWYLPRNRSKGAVNIKENAVDLTLDETHATKYYSQSILIQGVRWFITTRIRRMTGGYIFSLSTLVGGVYPILGLGRRGYPISGLVRGYPISGLGRGVLRLRSRGGYPSQV